MNHIPYIDAILSSNVILRKFDENVDPIELMWHRDEEDRVIESLYPTDWQFQFENELPKEISGPIFIPKYVWHRLIKGTEDLTLIIEKT